MVEAERCAHCDRPGLVELAMKVKSGQSLTMLSCTRCESRTWLSDGVPVTLDQVLKITAGQPDFVIQPGTAAKRRTSRR